MWGWWRHMHVAWCNNTQQCMLLAQPLPDAAACNAAYLAMAVTLACQLVPYGGTQYLSVVDMHLHA
jgi:hypothetical protein